MHILKHQPKPLEVFRTTDGKLHEHLDIAELHQDKLERADEIIELLGGSAFEVDKQFPGFLSGHGYVLIQQSDFDKAVALSNELLVQLDMSHYLLVSRAVYEHEHTSQISSIMMCLHYVHGQIRRYGQAYYANNASASQGINFSKKDQ